jgi:hypothetical protein
MCVVRTVRRTGHRVNARPLVGPARPPFDPDQACGPPIPARAAICSMTSPLASA